MRRKQESGYILLVVIMLLGILAIAGLSTTEVNITEQRMTVNAEEKARSFECAEMLRTTLSEVYPTYFFNDAWPSSAGGDVSNTLFQGTATGSLTLKVLGSDVFESGDTRHYLSSNPIPFLDGEGNALAESNIQPVMLRTDAQLVDGEGNVYAEVSIFSQDPKQMPGFGAAQNMGYQSVGHSAKNAMMYYYQLRSVSGTACSKNARTIIESDHRQPGMA